MRIQRTRVDPGFIYDAILGARLSYGSGAASDSFIDADNCFVMGKADETFLTQTLLCEDAGASKYLRTIPVSVFISAPLMWWVELDTFKVGTTRQSSSLMHRLKRQGCFRREDFDMPAEEWEDPTWVAQFDALNALVAEWLAAGAKRGAHSALWSKWQRRVPRSYIYQSHWFANYAVLRGIYFQRRHHRMSDQWKPFIEWIENLPYSQLITYEKPKRSE